MKLDVIKLDGSSAGAVDLGDDVFGLEPRADILAAQQGAGRHAQGQDPLRGQLLDQEDLPPEGHGWRTPWCTLGADLPQGRDLQGPDAAQPCA
jgi:hypothetical protein